jgi:NADPH:quinone reductase-like Zn-dependent oxidoreductase
MATFENKAAWIAAAQHKCEVEKGPTPNPSEDEVVIKVAYAAVNPVDWKVRSPGEIMRVIQIV